MRSVLIFGVMLTYAAPVFPQSSQSRVDVQNPATMMSKKQIIGQRAQQLGKPAPASAEVPPDTPVVTLDGVCDRSQVSGAKGCRTIITRAQMDSLIDALAPGTPQAARRQFAINYARLLAASGVAQRQHLEKNPAVANALQAQMKLVRMQVLANTLYHQIEEQADNVAASEIQKYYADHLANFDQGEVRRLSISKSAPTTSGQHLDAMAVKAEADELRSRAAAGEDFDQLQQQALKDLGITAAMPPTKLNMVRRTSLPPDEAKVFDLKPGEVSPVLDSPGALVILKLQSKQSMPAEAAQPEIKSILKRERLQQELQNATKSVKAQFNLTYLDMPSAPELFPPLGLTQPSVRPGAPSDLRQRMPSRRWSSSSTRTKGLTILPQPHN